MKPLRCWGRKATVRVAPCRAASPAGNVLTRIGTVADQPPQAPAGEVEAREQRVDPVLVVQAGGGDQHGEEEPGGAHQDMTLAAVELLTTIPPAFSLLRAAAHALAVDETGPRLSPPRPAAVRAMGVRARVARSHAPSRRKRSHHQRTVCQGGKSLGSARHRQPSATR